jgi:hypothetical protein
VGCVGQHLDRRDLQEAAPHPTGDPGDGGRDYGPRVGTERTYLGVLKCSSNPLTK